MVWNSWDCYGAIEGSKYTAREVAHPNAICPWNTDRYGLDPEHPGAQDCYDSLFRLYAAWGVGPFNLSDQAATVEVDWKA